MKRVLFDIAALIARIVTGVIFVAHGWQKWQGGHAAIAAGFGEMGIPMPELAAGYAMVVELIGGVLLILGALVRPVALLLLINMIGAVVFAHSGKGLFVDEGGWELAGALAALCLLFVALGGGRIGIDGIFGRMWRKRHERADEDLASQQTGRSGATSAGYGAGGPTTPARSATTEQPEVPRQQTAPHHEPGGSRQDRASRLSDDDMREIDSLVADEPPQHRKPPNR
ncbi:DoxX family protein [Nonomuraea fastidiosa]|jgi:putative oxidoreductase|uniref:DoxX family protein n=1 Tax=Nonomuraea TaxID=83681 RepID=UPI0032470D64